MTCKSHSKKVVQDVKMKENKGSAPIGSLLAVLLLQVLISCVQCQNTTTNAISTNATTTDATTTDATTTDATTTNATTPIITDATTTSAPEGEPTPLSTEAIAGIAVGGTAAVVAVVFFCLLVCCCCVRRRRARMFAPADDKAGAQLSDTLTYQATAPQVTNGIHKSNEAKKDDRELEMQINIADESVMTPDTSFAQESVETNLLLAKSTPAASNPHTLTTSDKGYVKMSSVGSIRSFGNDPSTETDGLYLNPDSVTVSAGFSKSLTPPSTSSKPVRPARSKEKLVESTPPPLEPEESQEDLYVETDVFVEDRHLQESDSYYNKDTIESLRQGRSLIDVVDPVQTHAYYANITGPPTPEHAYKPSEPDDKEESYENVQDFLGTSTASASASPQRHSSPQGPSSTEYYNYKPPVTDTAEEDYNYIEVNKPGVENPYALEDDQYVYMKSHSGSSPAHQQAEPPQTEANSKKHQHLDYHSTEAPRPGPKDHKYSNLDYEGEGIVRASTDPKKPSREIMAELHFPPKAGSVSTGSASSAGKKHLYMNLIDDDGPEQLYEEL